MFIRYGKLLFLLTPLLFLWKAGISADKKNAMPEAGDLRLWYQNPAEEWTEALPVGNGSLGGMIYGGATREHIQFNEDSLWTGIPRDYSNPRDYEFLPEIRRLLLAGKQDEAERLAGKTFMSIPLRQERYLPFGDIWIEFETSDNPEVSDYVRELDLNTAVAAVRYKRNGIVFTRSVFSSFPDRIMVIHLSANASRQLNIAVSLSTPHQESQIFLNDNNIILRGRVSDYIHGRSKEIRPSILKFEARLKIYEQNGELTQEGGRLLISGADSVTLILTAATSYKNYQNISADPAARCEQVLTSLKGTYKDLLTRHIDDYQELFNRVSIDLGRTDAAELPTVERILNFQEGNDPHLAALLFQYGRYLMISCSRPGSQPANLQGLWNNLMEPPWESKYTTNINFEMNYWPAEMCNLSECHEPMFALIRDCSLTGRKVAKMHYDSRGWVVHHNTDIWRGGRRPSMPPITAFG